jgi:hypothetical protein
MKKGRHRRFEEARALKRSQDVDLDALMDSLRSERPEDEVQRADHAAWLDEPGSGLANSSDDDEDEEWEDDEEDD